MRVDSPVADGYTADDAGSQAVRVSLHPDARECKEPATPMPGAKNR
jgi:hypothetical protein